jgi:hypothetical protein
MKRCLTIRFETFVAALVETFAEGSKRDRALGNLN